LSGYGTFFSVQTLRGPGRHVLEKDIVMLGWTLTFLVVAVIAALLGFGGVAIVSVEIAKAIFVVALILFVISAVFGFMRRGRSTRMQ
jgi:uncharacterized membrane protein YtjA (UPF0391 family)